MRGANERNGESMRILVDSHCHIYPEKIARKAVEGVRHFYEGLAFSPFDGTVETLRRVGEAGAVLDAFSGTNSGCFPKLSIKSDRNDLLYSLCTLIIDYRQ